MSCFGFFPKKDTAYAIKGIERFPAEALSLLSDDSDMLEERIGGKLQQKSDVTINDVIESLAGAQEALTKHTQKICGVTKWYL